MARASRSSLLARRRPRRDGGRPEVEMRDKLPTPILGCRCRSDHPTVVPAPPLEGIAVRIGVAHPPAGAVSRQPAGPHRAAHPAHGLKSSHPTHGRVDDDVTQMAPGMPQRPTSQERTVIALRYRLTNRHCSPCRCLGHRLAAQSTRSLNHFALSTYPPPPGRVGTWTTGCRGSQQTPSAPS